MQQNDPRVDHVGIERFVQSIKTGCLDRMILFGSDSLDRALSEYRSHYLDERPHQGLGNRLILGKPCEDEGDVQVHERLAGLLKSYSRAA